MNYKLSLMGVNLVFSHFVFYIFISHFWWWKAVDDHGTQTLTGQTSVPAAGLWVVSWPLSPHTHGGLQSQSEIHTVTDLPANIRSDWKHWNTHTHTHKYTHKGTVSLQLPEGWKERYGGVTQQERFLASYTSITEGMRFCLECITLLVMLFIQYV